MKPLIFLEMNELNFEFVQSYIKKGRLKNFSELFDRHGYCCTTSRAPYEELEPWIQWVSARTGKTYDEHGIFRLGDVVNSDVDQHWELLESKGFKVAAVSPINGANRTRKSPFWMPDPWVDTGASGDELFQALGVAIKQAVNDNASEKLSLGTLTTLIKALVVKARPSSWPVYMSGVWGAAKKQHWSKAIVLDRLLADCFFYSWKKHRPDFATLFLNSAAHIQHHYMFNSKVYSGKQKNPSWYIGSDADPMAEIYQLYDCILGEAIKLDARVMVGTGLRQVPYDSVTFYYRLKNHEHFFRRMNIPFLRLLPRMSRDFLVECNNEEEALKAANRLLDLKAKDGGRLFEVDNRGASLFVTLTYAREISRGFQVLDGSGDCVIDDFSDDVVFVAIKNGHHDATGYFMDTAFRKGDLPGTIPLEDLFSRTMEHFLVTTS